MWLHSLKVAQLLRSAACLHTNQSQSYLKHLVELCSDVIGNFLSRVEVPFIYQRLFIRLINRSCCNSSKSLMWLHIRDLKYRTDNNEDFLCTLKIHATAQRKFERKGDSYITVIYSFRLMKHENRVNVSPANRKLN